MAELKDAFTMFDKNGDGMISLEEFRQVLRALGQEPTDDELQMMMKSVDTDQSGSVDFDEFLCMMKAHLIAEGAEPTEEDELRAVFQVFDQNKNGYITAAELKSAMINLGERLTTEELQAMINAADIDGDGQIDYNEFLQMMRKK
jgi:Ca2+-binding EF-hand superfamily protein